MDHSNIPPLYIASIKRYLTVFTCILYCFCITNRWPDSSTFSCKIWIEVLRVDLDVHKTANMHLNIFTVRLSFFTNNLGHAEPLHKEVVLILICYRITDIALLVKVKKQTLTFIPKSGHKWNSFLLFFVFACTELCLNIQG